MGLIPLDCYQKSGKDPGFVRVLKKENSNRNCREMDVSKYDK